MYNIYFVASNGDLVTYDDDVMMMMMMHFYLNIKSNLTFLSAATEHRTQYASVDHVSLNPDPVVLPGDLTVGAHIQVNKDINSHGLKMNVNIYKVLLGQKTRVPCVSNVGSW